MSTILEISFIIIWIMILTLFYVINILLRDSSQIKKTYKKLIGQDNGLVVGSKFPVMELITTKSEVISIEQKKYDGTVILFTSVSCKSCLTVYPLLNNLIQSHARIQFISIILGTKEEIENKISEFSLNLPVTQITKDELYKFGTTPFPFGYFISAKGVIITKNVATNKQLVNLLIKSAYETLEN